MKAMKYTARGLFFFTLLISLVTYGCAGLDFGGEAGSGTEPADTTLGEPIEQMDLRFYAGQNVNWENEKPHPVVICYYQLQSPGAFTNREQNSQGINELLSCRAMDGSVLAYERITLQPSQSLKKTVQRIPGANYIGVVAGYYNFSQGKTTAVFEMDHTAADISLGKFQINVKKSGERRKLK
jgi:type VI secretion system VasD/TssJ family lipoprotein